MIRSRQYVCVAAPLTPAALGTVALVRSYSRAWSAATPEAGVSIPKAVTFSADNSPVFACTRPAGVEIANQCLVS